MTPDVQEVVVINAASKHLDDQLQQLKWEQAARRRMLPRVINYPGCASRDIQQLARTALFQKLK